MKHVLLISLVAGAVAGAGGAMVTSVLTMPVQPEEKAPAALSSDGSAEVRKELAELRGENERLWERVRFLEEGQGAAPSRLPAQAGAEGSLAALEREIEQLKATLAAPGGEVPPPTYAQIAAVIDMREAEEQRALEQQREERRLERIDQRVEQLGESLGLDGNQSRQMRDVLLAESTRRDALLESMREQNDFASAREEMRTLREELEASVSQILTPAQFEKYQESDSNDFGRGRGGFFRGADGGGGGGGRGGRGDG